jgi:hypothetical protein
LSFPKFLGPLQPLPRAVSPLGGAAIVGPGRSKNLQFTMQSQQGNNWCWAATASSVSSFFDPNSSWSQCQVASACLSSQCCASPTPCDVQFTLDGPLQQTGNLQGSPLQGSDTRGNVHAEIDNDRPVCCHIAWSGGTGHFVAVSGYDSNTDDVLIDDPLYGRSTVPYISFVSAYRGSGSWDFTYYTQP